MKDQAFDLSSEVIQEEISYNYTGEKDIYLDFQGEPSGEGNFIEMKNSTQRVTFTVYNTTTSQKVIGITPGCHKTRKDMLVYDNLGTLCVNVPGGGAIEAAEFDADAVENDIISMDCSPFELNMAGHSVDAVLDDGYIFAELADPTKYILVEAEDNNTRISHFLNFIRTTPAAGIGFHIGSDDTKMFEGKFSLKNDTPMRGPGQETRIPFQDAVDQFTQNTGKIQKAAFFQLDNETVSKMTFPATSEVSVTMVFSVVHSNAAALRRKAGSVVVKGKKVKKEELVLGKPVLK